jgi:hypothetical protein
MMTVQPAATTYQRDSMGLQSKRGAAGSSSPCVALPRGVGTCHYGPIQTLGNETSIDSQGYCPYIWCETGANLVSR